MRAIESGNTAAGIVVAVRDGRLDVYAAGGLEAGESAWFATDCAPDQNDGATRGALLEVVREAFKDPGLGISYSEDYRRWQVSRTTRKCFAETVATAKTAFKALLAAWRAAP
jgi:hypothetical protein